MVKNRARLILDLIIGFGIIFALFALYAFNYWNGDREAYETYYQTRSLGDWGVEVIYGFLSIAFRALGANYQAFNAAIAALSLLLVARFLLKSPGNLTMPAIAFAIAAFPLDYVLARYFLSSAIILNALLFLENDDDDHRYIKFILSILIATMTHQSSIIFSIFIFAGPRKSNYLILIKIICSISTLYALLRLQFDLPDLIHRHLSYYKTTIKTAIIYSLMHCAVVAVFIFATHIVSNRREFRFVRRQMLWPRPAF